VKVTMTQGTRNRLERMAEAQGRSVSGYVGVLVSKALSK